MTGAPNGPAPAAGGVQLPAAFKRKETQIAAGAAVLVAVVAFARRSRGGESAGPGGDGDATTQFSVAGPGSSWGGYDSSASDVYNAIQPQLEKTQGMLDELLNRDKAPTTPSIDKTPDRVPTPVPPKPATPAPKPATPKPAPVTKPATTTYVVRKGDNLTALGKKFGTSWNAIYASNRGVIGSNPNLIKPGQKLVIPAKK